MLSRTTKWHSFDHSAKTVLPKTQTIVIEGRVISKKNHQRIVKNFKTGAPFIVPNKRYKQFEADVLMQLLTHKPKTKPPYAIDYIFEMKGKGTVSDIDNMQASLNDILQKAGLIEDDRRIMQVRAIKRPMCKDWRTAVIISGF